MSLILANPDALGAAVPIEGSALHERGPVPAVHANGKTLAQESGRKASQKSAVVLRCSILRRFRIGSVVTDHRHRCARQIRTLKPCA
jgi:hypothetical protein